MTLLSGATQVSGATQATFYVSPTGSDRNPGTFAKPFQTLDQARDAVRRINANMSGEIDVVLRDGTYNLTSTLTFDQRDSGTHGFQVVWQAYPGEHPVLSGGKTIRGWTLRDASKNIWQASVGDLLTRQVYVNNVRAVPARSSGGLPGDVTQTATGYITTDTSLQNWKRPGDLEFVYDEQRIGVSRITGDSKQTVITMDPRHYPAAAPWDPTTGVELPTFIQNSYELLDQPGEWYLDHAAETLYYIPRPGESMKTATVVVPVLQTLVQGSGTLDSPIHDIQFKGLAFEFGGWTAPTTAKGFVMNQANFGYHDERMPANVMFTSAHHLVFQQDVFTHLGAAGLDLFGGSQNNLVDHCVFTDISGSGIQLGGIDDPNPSDVRARDVGNQITNNMIDNVADEYYGGIGIFAGFVGNTIIAHNEIAQLPYSGISLGWGWAYDPVTDMVNNQITSNHVHQVMQFRGDGGGIYTNGPQTNSIVQGNYVHDVFPIGIYEDEGSSFIDTSNNVVARTGDWVYIWNRNIHDLKVHDNFTDTRQYTNDGTRTYVAKTTVVTDGKWPAAAVAVMNSAGIVKQTYTSLFTTQTPVTPNVTDGVSHELGTKFQSSVGGAIQAIRYYKAPSETGTHIGRIWDNSGHLLATSPSPTKPPAAGRRPTYPCR